MQEQVEPEALPFPASHAPSKLKDEEVGAMCHSHRLQMLQDLHAFAMIRQVTVQNMQKVPSPVKAQKTWQQVEQYCIICIMLLSALKMRLHFSLFRLDLLARRRRQSQEHFLCLLLARPPSSRTRRWVQNVICK